MKPRFVEPMLLLGSSSAETIIAALAAKGRSLRRRAALPKLTSCVLSALDCGAGAMLVDLIDVETLVLTGEAPRKPRPSSIASGYVWRWSRSGLRLDTSRNRRSAPNGFRPHIGKRWATCQSDPACSAGCRVAGSILLGSPLGAADGTPCNMPRSVQLLPRHRPLA